MGMVVGVALQVKSGPVGAHVVAVPGVLRLARLISPVALNLLNPLKSQSVRAVVASKLNFLP